MPGTQTRKRRSKLMLKPKMSTSPSQQETAECCGETDRRRRSRGRGC